MIIKEVSEKGIREIQPKKGYNCCHNCFYLGYSDHPDGYVCRKTGKSEFHDPRFPYDNTKCKEFTQE